MIGTKIIAQTKVILKFGEMSNVKNLILYCKIDLCQILLYHGISNNWVKIGLQIFGQKSQPQCKLAVIPHLLAKFQPLNL